MCQEFVFEGYFIYLVNIAAYRTVQMEFIYLNQNENERMGKIKLLIAIC